MAKAYRIKKDIIVEFKNDMHQKQVADYLGISETHLSLVLSGKSNASRILALNISLLNREGELENLFDEVK